MKTCKCCLNYKPLTDFHKKKSGIMGVKATCKVCTSEWQAEHYSKESIKSKKVDRQRNPAYRLKQ